MKDKESWEVPAHRTGLTGHVPAKIQSSSNKFVKEEMLTFVIG